MVFGVCCCPVVSGEVSSSVAMPHLVKAVSWCGCEVETAIGVVVMEGANVVVVVGPVPWGMIGVPSRVELPVVGGVPTDPSRSPEPVIDDRTIDIYGFDDVVGSIEVFIAHHLYGDGGVRGFFHVDGGDILVDILGEDGLQDNQAVIPFANLHNAQVIDNAVAVEVKVIQVSFFGVEFFFKLFEVAYFAEQGGNGFEVEVLRNIGVCR